LPIWGGNTAWCLSPTRAYGVIRANRVAARQDEKGTEGISHGHGAHHLIVEDNVVEGVGDDLIAVHGGHDVVIRNNSCSGVDGAIFLSNCTGFIVDGNRIEHAAAPDGSWHAGHLLQCTNELTGPEPTMPCSDGRIVNNLLWLPRGLDAADGNSYMMRLRGVRRTLVAANVLRCDTERVAQDRGISVEAWPNDLDDEWLDAEQLDVGNRAPARPRWLSIQGNESVGTVDVGIGEMVSTGEDAAGPISWQGNGADQFMVVGARSTFSVTNRVLDGDPEGLTHVMGQRVPDALTLWRGSMTVTGSESVATFDGVPGFRASRTGIVFLVAIAIAEPLTQGSITVNLRKNGESDPTDVLTLDSADATLSKHRGYYSDAVHNRFRPGDVIEPVVIGLGLEGSVAASVELRGMYTKDS
jgi:hypothetical protein